MNSRRLCTDDCAKEAKDTQNEGIFGYSVYRELPVKKCEPPQARYPEFSYNHVNLRGRVGYGYAEDCLVDKFSALRNDPSQLTRDRCRQQLYTRIFQGCPNLKPGVADPDLEMPIMQGISNGNLEGTTLSCKRAIMEKPMNNIIPLVSCMQDIQDPDHLVEPWTRGGIDTRDHVLRQQMLGQCVPQGAPRAVPRG